VPGHRVLVRPTQELPLDQHLERGGQRVAVAPLVTGDGVGDLPPRKRSSSSASFFITYRHDGTAAAIMIIMIATAAMRATSE